jgi:hypothetical protein
VAKSFPARFPIKKPTDIKISTAMERLYDLWPSKSEFDNEFYTRFKYSNPEGFSDDGFISRRDPSKVIRVDNLYYVYYTCRNTGNDVVPPGEDDDTTPSTDWDLADIYVASSRDGFRWEEKGPALQRTAKGHFGCRSLSTPDILPWKGRYYLFVQVYSDLVRNDSCPVSIGVSDTPEGPFELLEKELIPRGKEGSWDDNSIHDPYPLLYNGKVYLYYKGHPKDHRDYDSLRIAQGVAIADSPEGPFEKYQANPVLNSGHETMLWPYRDGIAALQTRNGNEGNTVQYAPDGLNFQLKAIVDMPPNAGGPYIPDLLADNRDGRGILWGLSIGRPLYGGVYRSRLLRFDCSLSRDLERPGFRAPKNYSDSQFLAFPLSAEERTYLQREYND